jgi:hypothetical protein
MEPRTGKIVYIAGLGRSGSTIIDNILGQADGFFSAGEICDVWNQGCDEPCSCGKALGDCETWTKIFMAAYGREPSAMDFAHPLHLARRIDRLRHLWWLLILARHRIGHPPGILTEYLEITRRLYAAIFSVSGARVIVDSSKAPSHAYLLERLGLADVYIVHLIRDPRAVAFSWAQPKGKWPPKGLLRACMEWNADNLASEYLWGACKERYLRIAYEEFAERPRTVVQSIVEFAGEKPDTLPFVSESAVELRTLHGYGGAPGRYTGRIDIVPDTKWRAKMLLGRKLGVTALTIAGLLRYGYPLNFSQPHALWNAQRSGREAS